MRTIKCLANMLHLQVKGRRDLVIIEIDHLYSLNRRACSLRVAGGESRPDALNDQVVRFDLTSFVFRSCHGILLDLSHIFSGERIAFYPLFGKYMMVAVCKQALSCRMRDKMLLNGAAGPDDELWGLNAPFCFGVDGRRKSRPFSGLQDGMNSVACTRSFLRATRYVFLMSSFTSAGFLMPCITISGVLSSVERIVTLPNPSMRWITP
jgi:hypothetical protein